jgi:hypothetical protein
MPLTKTGERWAQFFDARTTIIASIAFAAISFLAIHSYQYEASFVWNVMNSEIWLNGACEHIDINDAFRTPIPEWWECDTKVPYRWVLALTIAIVGGALIARRRRVP